MLASVSNLQAIPSSYIFQYSVTDTSQHTTDLEKKDDDAIKSESSTPIQETSQNQQDLKQIQKLKSRDREVKTHEQAHLSAAGSLATGGASFTYSKGPNGVRYAIGGEVNIDTSPISGDPAATIRKADTIRRAALAPANPSAQDQKVASKASAMAEKARTDLIQLAQEEEKKITVAKKTVKEDLIDNTDETEPSDAVELTPAPGSLIDISV